MVILAGVGCVISIVLVLKKAAPGKSVATHQTAEAAATSNPAVIHADQTTAKTSPPGTFGLRPFATTLTRGSFEWTGEDGRDTNIIRQLAHNELEARRMMEENETIFRRQLVYRTQTMSAAAQHALQSGEPIRELLVPGLDGQEFQVEVRNLDLTDGGTNGTFSGHILGHPDSMVTMAFKGGREAFTIISIADNIFLHAEPREPGELIVKKVDPDKYGGLNQPCTVN